MSLAQDFADAVSRLLAPFLGQADSQIADLKAQLSASVSQVALLTAAATADHTQLALLQANLAAADVNLNRQQDTISAQAAEIASLKAAAGDEDEPDDPAPEADSPDGYSVAPGGQTITLGGHRYRVSALGKILIDDAEEATSAQVVRLVVKDGKLRQLNAKGDWWTQPLSGGAGVPTTNPDQPDPPVVVVPPVDPGTLPPVLSGVQLPAGYRTFAGMSIGPNAELKASDWQAGDTIIPYRADLPFIKDDVLGLPCTRLDDPNAGCAEVEFQAEPFRDAGEFWAVAQVDWNPGANFNNAPAWTYSGDPYWTGKRASEIDHEASPLFGDAQGVHEVSQSAVPPPMGPYYGWFNRGTFGVDFSKPTVWGIRYRQGDFVEWWLGNLGGEVKMTNRITHAQVPQGFPTEAMRPWASFRPTGWYANDADRAAKQNLKDGWTGQWNGDAGLLQILGFKSTDLT